jgi:hypothetical protein
MSRVRDEQMGTPATKEGAVAAVLLGRQANCFLLLLVVVAVAMSVEVVLNGNTPTLDPLFRLIGR